MSSKLMMRLLLVIMVVCGAVWLSFAKPTKLGLDLKGGVYVVLEAVPEEGVTITRWESKSFPPRASFKASRISLERSSLASSVCFNVIPSFTYY